MFQYSQMDYAALIEYLRSRYRDMQPRVSDWFIKHLRGSSDKRDSPGYPRRSRQHFHAGRVTSGIRIDIALKRKKQEVLSKLRRDDANHIARVGSAIGDISRAQARGRGVPKKRYEELRAFHRWILNRPRRAEAG